MIASKRSAGDCLKTTLSRAKLATSPRSLIRPSRIASSVPTSMSGTRPSSSIDWSGPLAERFKPSFSMEPIANRSRGALIASARRGGSHCSAIGKTRIGDSEQFARDDIDRAADREGDVNPGFGEVERDLGARIAIADDQHALARRRGRDCDRRSNAGSGRRTSPCRAMSAHEDSRPSRSRRRRSGALREFSPASARHARPSRRTARTGALKTGFRANFAA